MTELLGQGPNVIGAVLGETWYAGYLGFNGNRNQYGKTPELLAQLEIRYRDGTRQQVLSDAEWEGRHGPIRYSDLYHGEHYDARREIDG